MLRKLNKDELILLIEKINENHKKEIKREIKRIDDEHEIIIDACKELGVQFLKCYVKSCKAMRIRRGGFSEILIATIYINVKLVINIFVTRIVIIVNVFKNE